MPAANSKYEKTELDFEPSNALVTVWFQASTKA
jgi:hypothetical protein